MDQLPDLPNATRDAARWELEFALDPVAHAIGFSNALNLLAIRQDTSEMPDAAVASWIKAAEVAAHTGTVDRDMARGTELCALMNLIPTLLDQDRAEEALGFAERMITLDSQGDVRSNSLGTSVEFKANCLRRLGRTEEELSARVEALALFASGKDDPEVPGFTELMSNHTVRRIAEILDEEPLS